MTRTIVTVLAAAFALTAAPLSAHEGHAHKVMGTVTMVHDNHVEVTDAKGKKTALTVDAKTKIWRGKSPLRIADVKVGERVSVTYEEIKSKVKTEKSKMLVKMIQLGVTPAPAKTGKE
jgi:hypothetical protein